MPFEGGPYLSLACFCEQVLTEQTGVISLIRIVDRMIVERRGTDVPDEMPPATINWSLVISLKSGSARGTHEVRVEPTKPSGERMQPITVTAHLEGENRGQNIIFQVNMQLDMPGIYWFKILVNGQFLTQIPLEVVYLRQTISGPTLPAEQ